MNRKFLVAILTVALFSGAVVFGVHLMHRDALANTLVTCHLYDLNGDIDVDGILHVHFWLQDDLVLGDEMNNLGDGDYSYTVPPQSQYDKWDITIEIDYDPVDPASTPHLMVSSITHLEWEAVER
jgi:hypothetical protein